MGCRLRRCLSCSSPSALSSFPTTPLPLLYLLFPLPKFPISLSYFFVFFLFTSSAFHLSLAPCSAGSRCSPRAQCRPCVQKPGSPCCSRELFPSLAPSSNDLRRPFSSLRFPILLWLTPGPRRSKSQRARSAPSSLL